MRKIYIRFDLNFLISSAVVCDALDAAEQQLSQSADASAAAVEQGRLIALLENKETKLKFMVPPLPLQLICNTNTLF